MASIYELAGNWATVYAMADDPDMDADMWFDTMDSIEGNIESKADGCAKVIAQLNADAEALKAEADRLSKRKRAIDNSIKSLKQNLQKAMEFTGKTKFKTDLFSFNVQNNPASVVIDVEGIDGIPEEYLKYSDPDIDKKKIAEDLKAGKEISFAHLEQTASLRIR